MRAVWGDRLFWNLLRTLALALFASAGYFLNQFAFVEIHKLRDWERLPRTEILAVIPGEVNLEGRVEFSGDDRLTSPVTGTPCVFFRYVIEELKKDSEGKSSWRTIRDETKLAKFLLADATGVIPIDPSRDVPWDSHAVNSKTKGNQRFTEHILVPGRNAYVIGMAVRDGDRFHVQFNKPGDYSPRIGVGDEADARLRIAGASLYLLWAGISCLTLAVYFICALVSVHRILTYLTVVTGVVVFMLIGLGVRMLKNDLIAAHGRAERMRFAARDEIKTAIGIHSQGWDGVGNWSALDVLDSKLSDAVRRRVQMIRIDVARSIDRVNRVHDQFPDRFLAAYWNIPPETPITLSDSDWAEMNRLEARFAPTRLGFGWFTGIGMGVGFLFAWAASRYAFRSLKEKSYIENVPTSKTAGVAFGLAEVVGAAKAKSEVAPLSGRLSGIACVWYCYQEFEKRRSGKNTTWVRVELDTRSVPFCCVDAEGAIVVDPSGAEVLAQKTTHSGSLSRRYEESRIEIGDHLYILGSAEIDPETASTLRLGKGQDDAPFLLSTLREGEVMLKKARAGLLWMTAGLDFLVLGALNFFVAWQAFSPIDFLWAAMTALAYLAIAAVIVFYNELVFLRWRQQRAWSNIEVSLKKRHDLVPALEQVVKSYMNYERSLQSDVARMRNSLETASLDRQNSAELLANERRVIDRLMALREANPELKADTVVAQLTATLVTLENEVAFMRDGYNDSVERYNTRIQQFPQSLFASFFRFQPVDLFRADIAVRTVPTLSLP